MSLDENAHGEHLSDLGNQTASDDMTARPADMSAIHTSLSGIEKEGNFADEVHGQFNTSHISPALKFRQFYLLFFLYDSSYL